MGKETRSKQGSFKSYYEKLKNSINDEILLKFEKLKTDEERIKFLSDIAASVIIIEEEGSHEDKDLEEAKNLKELGNKAFVKGDNENALKLYTQSLIKVPFNNVSASDLAIILANRSACLYHMEEYESAINDIDYALSLEYPNDLRYKIHERKAKCLLAEQKHEEAIKEFRNTIQALDVSKLVTEKKLKMQTDIQIMLGVMTKSKTKSGHVNDFRPRCNNQKAKEKPRLELASNNHKVYVSMCDKVHIKEDKEMGLFAVAASDINAGDVLLLEKPHSFVLLQEFSHSHCLHCFKRALAPYSCANCSRVIFCSRECKTQAENTYHKYECPILGILYSSGISITVLMALRIIVEKPLTFFLDMKNKFSDERKVLSEYRSSDYEALYHLVRHENLRSRDDFFERSCVAYFLLQCLRKTKYFSQLKNEETLMAEHFIGSLILRHLQFLQFNAHEIFETELQSSKKLEARSVFIGGGVFPTLSLFNHSCDPGVVRYFDGTSVVVRAIKFISKGEIVAENYGPIFTNVKRDERRATLRDQYWFHCECKACVENWPSFDEMDNTVFRFRCDSRRSDGQKYNSCCNILIVPQSTDEFMVKCSSCGQHTNILKNLKILQDTDAMYKQATRDGEKGNYESALNIYLEILSTLNEIMAPPFKDYHLCQQAIRTCMLCLGNKFVKKD